MSGRQGRSNLGRRQNGKSEVGYERLGAQVQNIKNSNVYIFGDDDICEDEDVVEFEMENIRSRKGQRNHELPKETGALFVKRNIEDGDTLQSLSLRYGCPVAELKRVNNIIRDQEFYALTSVKIPVKKHSFLVEQITKEEDIKTAGCSKEDVVRPKALNGAAYFSADEAVDNTDNESAHDMSDPETQNLLIRKLSIGQTSRSQSKEARDFLESMDKDLSKFTSSKRTDRDSLDEVISVLTNKSVYPLVPPRKSRLNYYSINWKPLIVAALVVLVPLLYLGYLAYRHFTGQDNRRG